MGFWDRNWMNSGNKWKHCGIFLAGSERKNIPLVKGIEAPRRLVSFFELLGTCVGIRLWAPSRLGNNDLARLGIPIGADNLGNDFTIRKLYTSSMPTSWMLQELAVHSPATNTDIVSKRTKGDSGKWSIWAVKLIRNVSTQVSWKYKECPIGGGPNSGLQISKTNLRWNCQGRFLLRAKSV